jgi:hypothetical protein
MIGGSGDGLILLGLLLIFVYFWLFYEGAVNLYHGITESNSDAVRNGSLFFGGWLFYNVLIGGLVYYQGKKMKKDQAALSK